MFKIVKELRAWWPVVWPGVTEEGEVISNRIELRFRLLKVDEATALVAEAMAMAEAARTLAAVTARGMAEQPPLSVSYAETAMKFAIDWRGVAGENGEALPWTSENVRLLMNEPGVFAATIDAFGGCVRGEKATIEGN